MEETKTQDQIAAELEAIEREERDEASAEKALADQKRIKRHALKKAAIAKLGGKEGVAFNICDTPAGFILVKKGQGVLMKSLRKSDFSDPAVEDFIKAHVVFAGQVEGANTTPDELVHILDTWDATRQDLLASCAALHGHAGLTKGKK